VQGRKSRGTYRTGRAAAKPDWLTAAGEEVWMDDIARAAQMKLVSEADTTMFGNYCNLQGYIIMAWRKLASGDPEAVAPPIVAINQVTKCLNLNRIGCI
jgi:phage terminase small subunit